MEKTVKWLNTPPPSDTSSESPTLSDRKSLLPVNHIPIKRKRSGIFSRLRKSILGSSSSGNGSNSNDDTVKNLGLKRALSMDAGLQDRISQLAEDSKEEIDEKTISSSIRRKISKSRVGRSKSLVVSGVDILAESFTGIGSKIASPKQEEDSITVTNDSWIEACEKLNTPFTDSGKSLIDTIYSIPSASIHHVFECSWLAPTSRSQLFPGQIRLLPNSSSIQFNCQNLTRKIHLKFNFKDILNISLGTWNNKRNQALIIDLIRGKQKNWIFVAWTEDQYEQVIENFVKSWKDFCLNEIKSRLDRKKSHLDMKYCRIIRDADRSNEAGMTLLSLKESLGLYESFINFFKTSDDSDSLVQLRPIKIKTYKLKHELYNDQINSIIPQVLADILMEISTNFMANFRFLQGIIITNDTGWTINNVAVNSTRSFVAFVTKNHDSSKKMFKWKVTQKYLADTPENVAIESILVDTETLQSFRMIYEISQDESNDINSIYKSNIKISFESVQISNLIISTEEDTCKYFREKFFPQLFHLLEALINESQSDFDTVCTESSNKILLPPHFRFLKETIRITFLQMNLCFTTVLLPFTYKLVYFKQLKLVRYFMICLFILIIIRRVIEYYLKYDHNIASSIDVIGQFDNLLNDLAQDASENVFAIHSLKMKYKK